MAALVRELAAPVLVDDTDRLAGLLQDNPKPPRHLLKLGQGDLSIAVGVEFAVDPIQRPRLATSFSRLALALTSSLALLPWLARRR
jgi:hypothetical protein